MAIAELDGRQRTILTALRSEIMRQAGTDLDELDLEALALAVDAALNDRNPAEQLDEGKEPDELNAANDG